MTEQKDSEKPPLAQSESKNTNGELIYSEENRWYFWVAFAFSFIVLFLYYMPLYIFMYKTVGGVQYDDDGKWLSIFISFTDKPENFLNAFHKLLLPLVSIASIFAFKGQRPFSMIFLLILVISGLFLSLYLGVVTEARFVKDAVNSAISPDELDDTFKRMEVFFGRVQETSLMYMMVILGISARNVTGSKGVG
ncbi:hypothetical protein HUE56_16875 [Azospirillum oryzae]|uniref:Uncharacterized protein n=1 Tax=Azospirillum oryzae TaxID=286727 RepID=A0A6N1AJU9_9PROT|nr:hypothetical protein [Azospirillum oryzae]KAA0590809.1 hypothetical protein FZ938_01465 [Azospirillum oryzae]QKS52095.1 hypothetical protein HUE56_16875 [Azospirillum oryzae]GLR77861.1 hypothetical protein GCM10007856_05300 [Azospirillum oryzae]